MLSRSESGSQSGELRQFLHLVNPARPFDSDVDFLESDQVGFRFVDDFGQSRDVVLSVHAEAPVNVVAKDPQLARRLRTLGTRCQQ